MKKNLTILIVITILSTGCISTKYQIKKAQVIEPFTIELTALGKNLVPDQMISISDIGIEANKYDYHQWGWYMIGIPHFWVATIPAYFIARSGSPIRKNTSFLNLYKHDKISSEKISFVKDGKKFFGRIAFFEAMNFAKEKAVCSYYRISLPNDKLQQASEGRTACVYEYYRNGENKAKFPTWIIWVSDSDVF
jgi:hypothetical protein